MRRPPLSSLRTSPIAWSAAGLLVTSAALAAPVTWPADADWLEITGPGSTDPIGDSIGSRDIVGDVSDPVAQITTDATHMFLRMRVSDSPLQNPTNFRPFGWVCYLETDGDLTSFEYKIAVDGVNNPDLLTLEQNTVQGTPNSFNDPPEVTLSSVEAPLAADPHARVVEAPTTFGNDPDFYIDVALELATLTASGFDPGAPLRITCGSSNNGGTAIADATADSLEDAWGNPVQCGPLGCVPAGDSDGDGIDDGTEVTLGTDPDDADSDDDGVADGDEPMFDQDTDGDGLINALDPDSDDDGLLDGTELGTDCAGADTDVLVCVPDADGGATTTDPLDLDTDDGGVSDGSEDLDLDGAVDVGETNPTAGNGADDDLNLDPDGDGLSTGLELFLGTDPLDADSDDDGVMDGMEPNFSVDSDGDGDINALDPDSDDDGLLDGTELGSDCALPASDPAVCVADANPTTTTDPLDPDTDDGGVSDGDEDLDGNGRVDPGERDPLDPIDDVDCTQDTDCGLPNDGIVCDALAGVCVEGCRNAPQAGCPNGFECSSLDLTLGVCVGDTDGDGINDLIEVGQGTNPFDADSDDDGVIDGDEPDFGLDTDGDGLINALDPDSDDDGLFDGQELGLDCQGSSDTDPLRCRPDADGGATTTNPLDRDTDAGGVQDGSEDSNLDGAIDAGETNPTVGNGADDVPADSDGDGLSDVTEATLGSDPNDPDSDEDGLIDGREPNPSDDTDGDGILNVLDPDSDGDGLFDGTESGLPCTDPPTDIAVGNCIADADPGTTTDVLVADTDGGGIVDGVEDTNGNGMVDDGERNPLDGTDDVECTTDAGCGIADDGNVCDEERAECVEGCRGVDGAGCPDGEVCTSDDATLGECVDGAGGGGGQGGDGGAGGQGGQGGAGGQGGDGEGAQGPATTSGPGVTAATGSTATASGAGGGGGDDDDDLAGLSASGNGLSCAVSAPGTDASGGEPGRGGWAAMIAAVLGAVGLRRRRR